MKLYNPQTILPFLNVSSYLQGNTAIVGTNTAFSNTQASINCSNAANIGAIIRGAASQSADLQQWQDNTGNSLVRIRANGDIQINSNSSLVNAGVAAIGSSAIFSSVQLGVLTTSARVGAVIRGGVSQSADLQQWQNNTGVTLASVSSAGNISSSGTISAPTIRAFNTVASVSAIIARGAASQSADLQLWQNSASVTLASVEASGKIFAQSFRQATTWSPPTTATSPGVAGEFGYSQGYLYYCWSTNNWVRAALSTF
ncbi:hypothetical protein NIES2101_24055 [Calothrix sp. HK-06]|nr:hypothetical protein NIES2101_24055 [Calothrix sp. HK-06]